MGVRVSFYIIDDETTHKGTTYSCVHTKKKILDPETGVPLLPLGVFSSEVLCFQFLRSSGVFFT